MSKIQIDAQIQTFHIWKPDANLYIKWQQKNCMCWLYWLNQIVEYKSKALNNSEYIHVTAYQ